MSEMTKAIMFCAFLAIVAAACLFVILSEMQPVCTKSASVVIDGALIDYCLEWE